MYPETNTSKSKKLLVVLVAFVVLLAVPLSYFLVWRPSDTDYQSAIDDTATLSKDGPIIAEGLANTPPYFASQANEASFLTAVDSYQKTLIKLENSPVAQRGSNAKAELEKDKAVLDSFGKSVKNASLAIDVYYKMSESCGVVRFVTPSLTEKQVTQCDNAFKLLKTLPDSTFKSKFLQPYADGVQGMMTTLSKADKNNDEQLSKLRADMQKLYENIRIDYEISASPKSALDKISSILKSEKSELFR